MMTLADLTRASRGHVGGPSVARAAKLLCAGANSDPWADCAGQLWAGHARARTAAIKSLAIYCSGGGSDDCDAAAPRTFAADAMPPGQASRSRFFFEHSAEWWGASKALSAVDWSLPRRVMEIGAFEGGSTQWLLRYLVSGHDASQLVSLDLWSKSSLACALGKGKKNSSNDENIADSSSDDDIYARFRATACGNHRTSSAIRIMAGDSFLSLVKLLAEHHQQLEEEEALSSPSSSSYSPSSPSSLRLFDLIYVDGGHDGATALSDGLLSYRLLRPGGLLIFDDYVNEVKASVDALLAAHPGRLRTVAESRSLGAPQILLHKEEDEERDRRNDEEEGRPTADAAAAVAAAAVVEERELRC